MNNWLAVGTRRMVVVVVDLAVRNAAVRILVMRRMICSDVIIMQIL
jgi:hypothetical protein